MTNARNTPDARGATPVGANHDEGGGFPKWLGWLLGLLVIAALVVGAIFLLDDDPDDPDDLDVDPPALDIDAPDVDAPDIDAPDIDVDAPDVDVDPGDVDVEE